MGGVLTAHNGLGHPGGGTTRSGPRRPGKWIAWNFYLLEPDHRELGQNWVASVVDPGSCAELLEPGAPMPSEN